MTYYDVILDETGEILFDLQDKFECILDHHDHIFECLHWIEDNGYSEIRRKATYNSLVFYVK